MWLLTSVAAAAAAEATSHLLDSPQYHEWTLHDLSIIWRTLLGRGQVQPLLRGFELFQRVKKKQGEGGGVGTYGSVLHSLGGKKALFFGLIVYFFPVFHHRDTSKSRKKTVWTRIPVHTPL